MTWPPVFHQDVQDQIDLKLAITDARGTYAPLTPAGLDDPPAIPGAATLAFTSTFPVLAANILTIYDATSALPVERVCEPGGYGGGWTRDHAYVLQHQPRLFSAAQRRQFITHRLSTRSTTGDADPDGGFYPANFIADRLAQDGVRTFKNAGTSKLPYLDGIAFVILALWSDWRETGDTTTFTASKTVIDACLAALPKSANGCVYSDPATPSVDYGFTDSILKTGNVTYGTALLAWSYKMLAQISGENGSGAYTTLFNSTVVGLRTLRKSSGWYMGSSGNNSGVDDVWATALIVAEGLCSATEQYASAATLTAAYRNGQITGANGAGSGWVRHLPAGQYWTGTASGLETYQNGGYWATPLWDCLRAAALISPDVAFQWGTEAVREWNRQATASGATNAPYEWIYGATRGTLSYSASAALLARLSSPTTALRTATLASPAFSDTFSSDTSAGYTLSNFVYDGTLGALKSNAVADGPYAVYNAFSTADAGAVLSAQFTGQGVTWPGVILRYTDADNYIFCALGGGSNNVLSIYDRIAGVVTQRATVTLVSTQAPAAAGTYYTYVAYVIGSTVTLKAFGYTLTATTSIAAAGKVGVRHGAAGAGYTALTSITGFTMTAGTLPADVVLADDNGIVQASGSTNRIALTSYRLLDAKGRTLSTGVADAPISVT